MIISMGENIYPREVEELIYQFPGIDEVAVIGIDDKIRGQAGACFYSVREGQTVEVRLLKKFLQKNLALYKIPREFHVLDKLPRTSTGKIAKRLILKQFMEEKEAKAAKKATK
jgi:long-chain acyl-CoA synthetase